VFERTDELTEALVHVADDKSVETTALHVATVGVESGGDTTVFGVECQEARCQLRYLLLTCRASATAAGRHTGGHVRSQIPVSRYNWDSSS
jgi:hypothetical protein